MGCGGIEEKTPDDFKKDIEKLNELKSKIERTIEENKTKIDTAEKEMTNKDNDIKKGENDLRQNQYSYSDAEKKAKAKELLIFQQDRKRAQKRYDLLSANNANLKNNLNMVDSKIDEIRKHIQLMETDNIMKEIDIIDNGEILRRNIDNILRQQKKDEEYLDILEKGNKAFIGDIGYNSVDDYMKHILENKGNNEAPVAY